VLDVHRSILEFGKERGAPDARVRDAATNETET
jgi:hypothetical protein